MTVFCTGFSLVLGLILGFLHSWPSAGFTVIAFLTGCSVSLLSGFLGMRIAVYANSRTAVMCNKSLGDGFHAAFRAGAVMGFSLVALGLLFLIFLTHALSYYYVGAYSSLSDTITMYEALAGYVRL